ncbi:hypothetical protein DPD05_15645 [Salmonella enterica subsp. enterica serovar Ituri]|uniref:Conjugal transfer protein TraD n=2 Tax=Salmonella enterica TaxID=28901 RepID=A0A764PL96_SALER|nr:hypothetical protein [Salmonella enterica]EBQ9153007.1 hypothetical protein [Salmonella enterica subsp. enterica serovar Obogu]EBS0339646.1 hypothetical protein [Salmonella enterica subsp. enterica serovar Ituri]ECG1078080.1 hypothetical protein [Salmonella enterica subsp. enterica serovar Paratyphi C]ECL2031451.1 hypothetical protein [Salmonella enterica subsp. enterica]EDE3463099.1 hypothetical protein [Salmonella enterica subsp. enterica serovar Choleraesuis]EED9807231.1 hypothetical pr
MSKKIDKIENRLAYHQKQLDQLKTKKKEEVSKNKEAERRKRARILIEMGANICKVLGISYLEKDDHLPSLIGYLDLKKQNLRNSVYADRGNELLDSWKNGGDRNE